MKYRLLGNTGLNVSEVGLGCEHLQGKSYEQIDATISEALNGGVNILDAFMGEPNVRTNIGRAIRSRRDKVHIQGHICATWENEQYTLSRDFEVCKMFFEDFYTRYQTDYIDLGMFSFMDTEQDWADVSRGQLMEYMLSLKASGRVRFIGMSSHNPVTVKTAAESGLIDAVLFTVNPAYDLLPAVYIDDLFTGETYANDALAGVSEARAEAYRACEKHGVGITVMKGYAGGMLLSDKASPFGKALTPHQLIAYALSRPAVASVLVGCQTPEEVQVALSYEHATHEERDYARALTGLKHFPVDGRCMYCNHCQPCPVKLDIAAINRYLDAAKYSDSVPETIREHYLALDNTAQACIRCGICENRCPFGVEVRKRMDEACKLFGS